jgi:hypothetical protein
MEILYRVAEVTLPPPRPFTTAIALTNAVTVILTFTTASQ